MTIGELAGFLEREAGLEHAVLPDPQATIEGFSPLLETRAHTLTWTRSRDVGWSGLAAAAIIVPEGVVPPATGSIAVFPVPKPRLAFVQALREFGAAPRPSGIEPTAEIAAGAVIGDEVFVGRQTTIAAGVEIGAGTVIHDQVSIRSGTRIGAGCTIWSGAVIGDDGFGFERLDDDRLLKFEHIGGVRIEDGVEIGSNACVDRGPLGDTVIGAGTKIDNLVHVGHSAQLGPGGIVAACSELGAIIAAEGFWLGPRCAVLDGVRLGAHSYAGIGSVIIRDVAPHELVYGVPARPGGWMCSCHRKLEFEDDRARCSYCGREYASGEDGVNVVQSR